MASGPITSWQIVAETMETVTDFIFLGTRITADGDCSHKIKKTLTLPTKVYLVKAMVFPVVMYGCKSWTIKKAERHSIDAFELWWWGQPFESPLACKEIKPVNPKGYQS